MTINERVSEATIDGILSGVIEGVEPTTQEVAMARELKELRVHNESLRGELLIAHRTLVNQWTQLQQYRAAAEPVYQYQAFTFVENSDGEQEKFWFWSDCDERFYTACKGTKRILYAAPQVTSVPDELTTKDISYSIGHFRTHRDCYRDGWNACRTAILNGGKS